MQVPLAEIEGVIHEVLRAQKIRVDGYLPEGLAWLDWHTAIGDWVDAPLSLLSPSLLPSLVPPFTPRFLAISTTTSNLVAVGLAEMHSMRADIVVFEHRFRRVPAKKGKRTVNR